MKALIFSDLRTSLLDRFHPRPLMTPMADVCICAGDIADGIERSIDLLHAGRDWKIFDRGSLSRHQCQRLGE